MAVLLPVLLVVAKVLTGILAALTFLVVALLVLPVRARVSGRLRVRGDCEEFFDGDGLITLAWDGSASAAVLGGLLGADYSTDDSLKVSVLGIRFQARLKARERQSSGEAAGDKRSPAGGATGSWGAGSALQKRTGETAAQVRPKSRFRSMRAGDIRKWLAPEIREQALSALRSAFRAIHPEGRVDAECGFPDPGVTGMAYAAFVTWSGATRQTWFSFTPNFVENVVSVQAAGRIRLVPAQSAWIAGRFLLSRDIRPLWRKKRAGESKKAPMLGAHTTG